MRAQVPPLSSDTHAPLIRANFVTSTSFGILFSLVCVISTFDFARTSFPPGPPRALDDPDSAATFASDTHINARSCSANHAAVPGDIISDNVAKVADSSSKVSPSPAGRPIVKTASVIIVAHNEHAYVASFLRCAFMASRARSRRHHFWVTFHSGTSSARLSQSSANLLPSNSSKLSSLTTHRTRHYPLAPYQNKNINPFPTSTRRRCKRMKGSPCVSCASSSGRASSAAKTSARAKPQVARSDALVVHPHHTIAPDSCARKAI